MTKNFRTRGEVATVITLATLLFLAVTTFVSNKFIKNQKATTSSFAQDLTDHSRCTYCEGTSCVLNPNYNFNDPNNPRCVQPGLCTTETHECDNNLSGGTSGGGSIQYKNDGEMCEPTKNILCVNGNCSIHADEVGQGVCGGTVKYKPDGEMCDPSNNILCINGNCSVHAGETGQGICGGTSSGSVSPGTNNGSSNKIDITGATNPACCGNDQDCVANTPGIQKCSVQNGFCKSGFSCAAIAPNQTQPLYARVCGGNTCGWTFCNGTTTKDPVRGVNVTCQPNQDSALSPMCQSDTDCVPPVTNDTCFYLTDEIYYDAGQGFSHHVKFYSPQGGGDGHITLAKNGANTGLQQSAWNRGVDNPFVAEPQYTGGYVNRSETATFTGTADHCKQGIGSASISCTTGINTNGTVFVRGGGCTLVNVANVAPTIALQSSVIPPAMNPDCKYDPVCTNLANYYCAINGQKGECHTNYCCPIAVVSSGQCVSSDGKLRLDPNKSICQDTRTLATCVGGQFSFYDCYDKGGCDSSTNQCKNPVVLGTQGGCTDTFCSNTTIAISQEKTTGVFHEGNGCTRQVISDLSQFCASQAQAIVSSATSPDYNACPVNSGSASCTPVCWGTRTDSGLKCPNRWDKCCMEMDYARSHPTPIPVMESKTVLVVPRNTQTDTLFGLYRPSICSVAGPVNKIGPLNTLTDCKDVHFSVSPDGYNYVVNGDINSNQKYGLCYSSLGIVISCIPVN